MCFGFGIDSGDAIIREHLREMEFKRMMQGMNSDAIEKQKEKQQPTLKVTVHEDETEDNQEWEYPLLVKSIHNDAIVFATADDGNIFSGTLIESNGDGRPIGFSSGLWKKDAFKPFRGKVVLQNE